jgi:hypothetical protein
MSCRACNTEQTLTQTMLGGHGVSSLRATQLSTLRCVHCGEPRLIRFEPGESQKNLILR